MTCGSYTFHAWGRHGEYEVDPEVQARRIKTLPEPHQATIYVSIGLAAASVELHLSEENARRLHAALGLAIQSPEPPQESTESTKQREVNKDMNVFDSEIGPLTDQHDAEFLVMLAEAGCTPQEARAAMKRLTEVVN